MDANWTPSEIDSFCRDCRNGQTPNAIVYSSFAVDGFWYAFSEVARGDDYSDSDVKQKCEKLVGMTQDNFAPAE